MSKIIFYQRPDAAGAVAFEYEPAGGVGCMVLPYRTEDWSELMATFLTASMTN